MENLGSFGLSTSEKRPPRMVPTMMTMAMKMMMKNTQHQQQRDRFVSFGGVCLWSSAMRAFCGGGTRYIWSLGTWTTYVSELMSGSWSFGLCGGGGGGGGKTRSSMGVGGAVGRRQGVEGGARMWGRY